MLKEFIKDKKVTIKMTLIISGTIGALPLIFIPNFVNNVAKLISGATFIPNDISIILSVSSVMIAGALGGVILGALGLFSYAVIKSNTKNPKTVLVDHTSTKDKTSSQTFKGGKDSNEILQTLLDAHNRQQNRDGAKGREESQARNESQPR